MCLIVLAHACLLFICEVQPISPVRHHRPRCRAVGQGKPRVSRTAVADIWKKPKGRSWYGPLGDHGIGSNCQNSATACTTHCARVQAEGIVRALSPRMQELYKALISSEKSVAEIYADLGMSQGTGNSISNTLYRRLECNSRVELCIREIRRLKQSGSGE